ncbi:c-type cytochrome [Sedimentitalea sp. XS_ASV28]|uniref:WD40 domain-containing protein n=1 Tax=Sedimentitalea sp. XS_ASV28 TaxID=3241296 RepID=UPI0035198E3E
MWRALALTAALLPLPVSAQDFFTLKGHGGPIMDIAVSQSGRIATASFDNAVGLWTGETPNWFEGHRAAVNTVIFAGESTLVSAGDDFQIRVWDIAENRGRTIGTHKGKVVDLAYSPSANLLAAASWDGSISLWSLPGQDTGEPLATFDGHDQGVNGVAFSPDGGTLYSASMDGSIRLWDIETASERQILVNHGFGINELVLNPRAGWLAYGAVDGVTRIVDTDTGTELHDFTLDRRPILAMALSRDGRFLAVGDGEGYIMVIDTRRWRVAHDFRATLRGPVWALAFSNDGANIHAGGLDEAIYSWPLANLDAYGPMAATEHSYLRDPAAMDNGERQFVRKCSICHSLTPGSGRRAGPTLYRLFGRPAGSVPDYAYSRDLSASGIIWDAESINALFDLGPDHYIPGSKMPMQRITNPGDRADLIAYMRRATAGDTTE